MTKLEKEVETWLRRTTPALCTDKQWSW